MNFEVEATHYFYSAGAMIVRVVTVSEVKYYMAACFSGNSLEQDVAHVRDWGSTFPYEAGSFMFLEGYFNPL